MPLSVTTVYSGPFTPNGVTTIFPFDFKALDPAEVAVTDSRGDPISGLDYAVEIAAEGGNVVFGDAPEVADLASFFIASIPTFEQDVEFTPVGIFNPRTLQTPFDRTAVRDAWLKDRVDRALRFPMGDTVDYLPAATDRANRFLSFDADGNPVMSSGTGADDGLREDLADPVAGATLIAVEGGGTAQDKFTETALALDKLYQADLTLSELTVIAQAKEWAVGDAVFVPIYGGSRWTVRSEIILQNHFAPQLTDSSKVDFDGPLEIVVPLVGGGSGMLDCDLASIKGFVSAEVSRLRAQLCAKFERKVSLVSMGSVYAYGTSLTYGQINTPQAGEDTGFGDGSQHVWEQAADPWPAIAQSFSSAVLGADKLPFVNRGFSGDRAGNAYRRHRFVPVGTSAISVIEYGTNDALYATDSGDYPEGLFEATPAATSNENGSYTFDKFVTSLRRFAYREVVRGSLPIMLSPYNWIGSAAYDGTDTAMGKIVSAFREAHGLIANEIGAVHVDGRDIINARDLDTMTTDGLHLDAAGRNVYAAGIVAAVIGSVQGALRVSGPAKLNFLPHDGPVNGPATAGALDNPIIPNTNTLGRPYVTATQGADNTLNIGQQRFLSVYLDCDEMSVIPVGYISAGGTLTINVDFGATQGKAKLNTQRGAALGDFITFASSIETVNGTGGNIIVNHPSNAPILTIAGRGYHLIGLSAAGAASVISGLSFDPAYGRMGAAVSDAAAATYAAPTGGATVDAEARAAIVQLAADNASLRTAINTLLSRARDRAVIDV